MIVDSSTDNLSAWAIVVLTDADRPDFPKHKLWSNTIMAEARTYKDLAEAWGIKKDDLYKAKSANADILQEGTHYSLGDKGEYLWNSAGERILAQSLNLDVEIESDQLDEPEPTLEPDPLTLSISDQISDALAEPIALQAWQMLPSKVFASMRRMLHAPANDAEASAVSNAMQSILGNGSVPLALSPTPPSQGEQ